MSNNTPEVLLYDISDLCKVLNCGRTHLNNMRLTGQFAPDPILFGRKLLFRADEIRAYVKAGMPNRKHWKWGEKR